MKSSARVVRLQRRLGPNFANSSQVTLRSQRVAANCNVYQKNAPADLRLYVRAVSGGVSKIDVSIGGNLLPHTSHHIRWISVRKKSWVQEFHFVLF